MEFKIAKVGTALRAKLFLRGHWFAVAPRADLQPAAHPTKTLGQIGARFRAANNTGHSGKGTLKGGIHRMRGQIRSENFRRYYFRCGIGLRLCFTLHRSIY